MQGFCDLLDPSIKMTELRVAVVVTVTVTVTVTVAITATAIVGAWPVWDELAHLHDTGDLNGHHRHYLHLSAVELIHTCPGTGVSQPAEHLAVCHLVVHAIAAVDCHDMWYQGFANVLQQQGRRLASTS